MGFDSSSPSTRRKRIVNWWSKFVLQPGAFGRVGKAVDVGLRRRNHRQHRLQLLAAGVRERALGLQFGRAAYCRRRLAAAPDRARARRSSAQSGRSAAIRVTRPSRAAPPVALLDAERATGPCGARTSTRTRGLRRALRAMTPPEITAMPTNTSAIRLRVMVSSLRSWFSLRAIAVSCGEARGRTSGVRVAPRRYLPGRPRDRA